MNEDIVAPADWRAIDFISDLHLSSATPAAFVAWREHLQHTPAQAVFMLGDLFELWVGDDAAALPFEAGCVESMAAAARHRWLAFLAGNRDFLVGDALAAASGLRRLGEPVVVEAFGTRALLCHGDALCIEDVAYQRFRAIVRGDDWQRDFLARPLQERLALAAAIRRHSEERRSFDGHAAADVDASLAQHWLDREHAQVMVHGHTHRPASHRLPGGGLRHVLSDWELDTASPPRAEVLRWTDQGFSRVAPSRAPS